MSAMTSATMVSAGTVITGDVSTSLMIVSGLRPSASTRERRSRSVRMPIPFARSTNKEDTRSRVISSAASRMEETIGAITGGRRTSEPTGVCHGSTAEGSIPSSARTTRRRSVDDRNANPECVPRTSSATSRSIR